MIPGKKYKPEDFVQIAWARRWFVVVPFVLIAAGAIVYAQLQPNRYRASTQILIVPQQVPAAYVRSTVTTPLSDRLRMISQEILSRTQLERIVQEFDLYRRERSEMIMEDVIERMRGKDINVDIAPNSNRSNAGAFMVSYESENARTALVVTERLASLFIRGNLEDRAVQADATSQFLDAQLEEARRKLIDHEKRLEEYRRKNAGSLPTQVQSNLQGIQTAQMQLQSLADATGRDRDRRLFLERTLSDATAETPIAPTVGGDPAALATVGAPIPDRLQAARNGLRSLELRLKPEHPDVLRVKRLIRDLEKEADAAALEGPVSEGPAAPRPVTPAEKNRQSRMASIQAEIDTIDRRLTGRQADEQRLRNNLAAYQARVEAAPGRESEMVELMRDYETLKTSYTDLLRKSEASQLAVNLERRQIGEQFKIVDGARLPERPISPDRPRIMVLGALAGLALGLGIVGFLEYRDSTLKTDDDVVTALALPVLAMIPVLATRAEAQSRTRRRRLLAATSVVGVLAAIGLVVWKLRLIDTWVG